MSKVCLCSSRSRCFHGAVFFVCFFLCYVQITNVMQRFVCLNHMEEGESKWLQTRTHYALSLVARTWASRYLFHGIVKTNAHSAQRSRFIHKWICRSRTLSRRLRNYSRQTFVKSSSLDESRSAISKDLTRYSLPSMSMKARKFTSIRRFQRKHRMRKRLSLLRNIVVSFAASTCLDITAYHQMKIVFSFVPSIAVFLLGLTISSMRQMQNTWRMTTSKNSFMMHHSFRHPYVSDTIIAK